MSQHIGAHFHSPHPSSMVLPVLITDCEAINTYPGNLYESTYYVIYKKCVAHACQG